MASLDEPSDRSIGIILTADVPDATSKSAEMLAGKFTSKHITSKFGDDCLLAESGFRENTNHYLLVSWYIIASNLARRFGRHRNHFVYSLRWAFARTQIIWDARSRII